MDETTNGTEDIWGINPAHNNAYPFLWWQNYVNVNVIGTIVISQDSLWSANQTLSSNICIEDGVTLTIAAGVHVHFTELCTINVLGRILAQGTAADMVDFSGEGDGWGGVRFDNVSTSNDSSRFTYCEFWNGSNSRGGAVHISVCDKVLLRDCVFDGNRAVCSDPANHHLYGGGAIYIYDGSPIIERCQFMTNEAVGCMGGAIYVSQNAAPVISNCCCFNNAAEFGGGLFALYAGPKLFNCLLCNNYASMWGGGAYLECGAAQEASATNCTFWDNHADVQAGGVFSYNEQTFRNTIIFNNGAPSYNDIYVSGSSNFHYCDVAGYASGSLGATSGTVEGCFGLLPMLENITGIGYTLHPDSPCINAGDPATSLSGAALSDINGDPRYYDSSYPDPLGEAFDRVDIGAVEYQAQSLWLPGGITLDEDIAINDTLKLTYERTLTVSPGVTIFFASDATLLLYGQLHAIGAADSLIVFTAQSPASGWPGLRFLCDEADQYSLSRLEYCLLEHGRDDANCEGGDIYASGLPGYGDTPGLSLRNCRLQSGQANRGGAIYIDNARVELAGCLISGNLATSGGAIYSKYSNIDVNNCTLVGNTAFSGDDIYVDNEMDTQVRNSILWSDDPVYAADPIEIVYSIVRGGYAGAGVLDADPCFADDGAWPYRPAACSPTLNAGAPDTTGCRLPPLDISGAPRIHSHYNTLYNRVDIGAYEYAGCKAPVTVDASNGSNDYPGYVHIEWACDETYLPAPTGFRIYRDSMLTGSAGAGTFEFDDDTIVAGQVYQYQIESYAYSDVGRSAPDGGYIRPNGVITGSVLTLNGNPVPGVAVALEPSPGSCLLLDAGANVTLPDPQVDMSFSFTLECWTRTVQSGVDILARGSHRLFVDASGRLAYTDGAHTLTQNDLSVACNDDEWRHLAVVNNQFAGAVMLYLDGEQVAADSSYVFGLNCEYDLTTGAGFEGGVDDIRIWNTARSSDEIFAGKNITASYNAPGLMGCWPMNEGDGEDIFDSTNNERHGHASGCTWSTNGPPVTLGAVTDYMGLYAITQIPYGPSTSYYVRPGMPGHSFQPQQNLVTLTPSNTALNNINFVDNSYRPISGVVRYWNTDCPVEGAIIYTRQTLGGDSTAVATTDSDGAYVFEVEPGTEIIVSASFNGHGFDRMWSLTVNAPRNDINFFDMFTTSLAVEVVGGEDAWPIGDFDVQLTSICECITIDHAGDDWSTGGVRIDNLPPLAYNVTVSPAGDDPFNLAADTYFLDNCTQTVSLTGAEPGAVDTLRFIWRAPVELVVTWPGSLSIKSCPAYPEAEFYVLQQNEWCDVNVKAKEDYSFDGRTAQVTWLGDCAVNVVDDIGATGGGEGVFNGPEGFTYTFAPYLPNIASGYDRQYQNPIEFSVTDALRRVVTHTDWALTEGVRPMESTYATTSPELPFLILHDPPGDASFASFGRSSSHSVSIGASVCTDSTTSEFAAVHMGLDTTTSTGFFFCVETSIEITNDYETGLSTTSAHNNSYEESLTFTTSEEYSTSDSDAVIGAGADLYVGGAVNLIWGLTRVIDWDDALGVLESDNLMVTPSGFATQYFYTEHQILNTVIPNLLAIGDSEAASRWQEIVDDNNLRRDNADPNPNHPGNVSFNAGAGYSYVEETASSASQTYTFDSTVSSDFGVLIDGVVNGIGGGYGYTFESSITLGSSNETTEETLTTSSFTLGDDDLTSELNELADYFTVDIGVDPVYGTPVFKLLSGASSCPWEPNTQPRDGVELTATPSSAHNLPNGEEAAFVLNLRNTSQTGEDRRYCLEVMQGTNPTGATVKINGTPLEGAMSFDTPGDGAVQAVMTVAQGPLEYQANDLTIELYAPGDRGNDGPAGHSFDEFKSFDISWEAPFSRVEIARPEDGWIVNQASAGDLEVMLTGYDIDKPFFQRLQLEYRHPADQYWNPALTVSRDTLANHPVYYIANWPTEALSDGVYQIRATAVDSQHDNFHSLSLSGVIDCTPPEAWGVPQPADGLLEPGDLISLRFNEEIDPASLDPGDVTLRYYGGATIGAEAQICGAELAIVPSVAGYDIENRELQACVAGLEDCCGNPMSEPVEWEFFVNASPVGWGVSKVELIKPLGETMVFTVELENTGGYAYNFTLDSLPSWLAAQPMNGLLQPLDAETITFTVSSQIGFGDYAGQLFADLPGLGREPLTVEVSVLADPPEWTAKWSFPHDYSMALTGRLIFDGQMSADTGDIIGAFIKNNNDEYECRGVARIEYVDYLEGSYLFFLTVHSDVDYGEEILFRVWDNSEAKEHYGVTENYVFMAGAAYGSPVSPDTLHVSQTLLREIDCAEGWTWLSANVRNESSMALNDILESIEPADGDLIKSQTAYAQYVSTSGWVGALDSLDTTGMYKLRLTDADRLRLTGLLEAPDETVISYGAGWNWIGFIPHVSIAVEEALADIDNLTTSDMVKSQQAFAQYIDGYGWFGSLRFMNPGEGYMLHTANAGDFTYPEYIIARAAALRDEPQQPPQVPGWELNPLAFELTANITGVIQSGGAPLDSTLVIGAFVGEECRGIAAPVEALGQTMYFLTLYANANGETITFKAYDTTLETFIMLDNSVVFIANQILGDPLTPYAFLPTGAQLDPPQNITIAVEGDEIALSWDACPSATGYRVWSAETCEGPYEETTAQGAFESPEESGGRSRVAWRAPLPAAPARYYRVTAYIE